jgi:positive regulator of sigma E activity
MKTKARVIKVDGAIAWVRVCHGEYCAGCGLHSAEDKLVDVAVRNMLKAKVGERVEVTSDEARMVRTMFFVFWFPLAIAALLAWLGYMIGARFASTDPTTFAVLAGLLGVALGLWAVYRAGKRTQVGAGLTISRVLLDEEGAACSSGAPFEGGFSG